MFGIKTQVSKFTKNVLGSFLNGNLTNKFSIKHLMENFRVDEEGHRANTKNADLGYGWIHYSLIRVLKPKHLLCIGSGYGFVPAVMAQACKDAGVGHVDFVDPGYGPGDLNHWTGQAFWKSNEGKSIFEKFGLKKWITHYLMENSKFAQKRRREYGYIYIDGDHSVEGVSLDFELFWPRLIDGGVMLFHDICVKGNRPEGKYGVNRFWKGISKRSAISFEFSKSGLGVLQKKQ
jgi:predicted O-methyltransferase YrrM